MKMRFTDTHKWQKLWFRGISPEAKLLLLYLYDRCGDAGVIEKDPLRYSFETGLNVGEVEPSLKELIDLNKLKSLSDRFYILPSFIKFQYPKGIKRGYNPHKSVFRELDKHEINIDEIDIPTLEEALPKATKIKDKIRIKDKNKIRDRIRVIWHKATQGKISPRLTIDEGRLSVIERYLEDHSFLGIVKVWQEAGKSDFLTNRKHENRNGWVASFDWIHKPANWRKVRDGEYENRGRKLKYAF